MSVFKLAFWNWAYGAVIPRRRRLLFRTSRIFLKLNCISGFFLLSFKPQLTKVWSVWPDFKIQKTVTRLFLYVLWQKSKRCGSFMKLLRLRLVSLLCWYDMLLFYKWQLEHFFRSLVIGICFHILSLQLRIFLHGCWAVVFPLLVWPFLDCELVHAEAILGLKLRYFPLVKLYM